jgi:hypothetical protein
MNDFYVIPNNKDVVFNNLILPLKDYSIGFDVYYTVSEINSLSKKLNISVIINKFLHKEDIKNIINIINELEIDNIKYIFVEDLGLVSLLDNNKVVVSQNHIINNYDSINYFKSLGYSNILVNNDLTINELKEIISKTSSNLFMYFISKNNLMYSKRRLLTAFSNYKNSDISKKEVITEKVTNHKLIIKEEKCGTCIFNKRIFAGNKYMSELSSVNKIVNLSNMDEFETKTILKYMDKVNLSDYIEIDDYFLDNVIPYKVGDIK